MLSGKQISDMDQSSKALADHVVPMLASFFKACVANDFTRAEAMQLTITHYNATLALGAAANKDKKPPENT